MGASLTWRFRDAIPHNVLLANGPRLVGSPTLKGGATATSRFPVAGRYELFCYLHPVTMHEIVDVVPRGAGSRASASSARSADDDPGAVGGDEAW